MSPPVGIDMTRDTVARKRARIMALTRLGWSAREVAREMRMSDRQVQRHRSAYRAGRPAGKPPRLIPRGGDQ
jgi:hypothetical protein